MDAVDRIMSRRWEWGVSDCSMAAADVFLGLWGVDPMTPHRGIYSDAMGAVRLIRSYGGFASIAAASARMTGLVDGSGMPGEIGISVSGAASGPEGRAMLICIEPGAWAGKTELGYAVLPQAERCWRVARG